MSKIGFKLSDGKAENLTVPDDEVVNDGDLYRITGLNGFAIVGGIARTDGVLAADDPVRTIAFEMDTNAVWYVKASAAVISANPIVGALLYWDDPAADFQDSGVDLVATPAAAADAPCCQVYRRKDAAGYIAVRVLNGGNGTA